MTSVVISDGRKLASPKHPWEFTERYGVPFRSVPFRCNRAEETETPLFGKGGGRRHDYDTGSGSRKKARGKASLPHWQIIYSRTGNKARLCLFLQHPMEREGSYQGVGVRRGSWSAQYLSLPGALPILNGGVMA